MEGLEGLVGRRNQPFPGSDVIDAIHKTAILYGCLPSQVTLYDVRMAMTQKEPELSPEEFALYRNDHAES